MKKKREKEKEEKFTQSTSYVHSIDAINGN